MEEERDLIIRKLARKMGANNAQKLLSELGNGKKIRENIESEAGQLIINNIVKLVESGIEQILQEKDDVVVRADVRANIKLLQHLTALIVNHEKNEQQLKTLI